MRFLFGFGVAFLLPVLLMVLERAGIVTREQLAKSRRYAIVVAAAVSAVLTPPDVVSMLLMLVPLYALYEFAILAIRLTHWRAARKARSSCRGQECGPENATGGGGGLAVPGPFRRIARAGGQKVTIRPAKRPFFRLGSRPRKNYSTVRRIFCGDYRVGENRHGDGIAAKLPIQRRAKLAGQAFDDPFELLLAQHPPCRLPEPAPQR